MSETLRLNVCHKHRRHHQLWMWSNSAWNWTKRVEGLQKCHRLEL